MNWRYCVIRKTKRYKGKTYHHYDIHEMYRSEKTGEVFWTETPVDCNGMEDLKSLQIALTMMLRDSLEAPVMEIRKGKLVERGKKPKPTEGSERQLCIECGEPVNPADNSVLNCHENCRLEI